MSRTSTPPSRSTRPSSAWSRRSAGPGTQSLRSGSARRSIPHDAGGARGSGVNASHFGVQVAGTEDVAIAWTRFKEAGLKTFTEENTSCCYALQDKVWTEDPDGNLWEVFVVKGDAATMHDDPTKTSAACCAPASLSAQDKPLPLAGRRADAAEKAGRRREQGPRCSWPPWSAPGSWGSNWPAGTSA